MICCSFHFWNNSLRFRSSEPEEHSCKCYLWWLIFNSEVFLSKIWRIKQMIKLSTEVLCQKRGWLQIQDICWCGSGDSMDKFSHWIWSLAKTVWNMLCYWPADLEQAAWPLWDCLLSVKSDHHMCHRVVRMRWCIRSSLIESVLSKW